MNESVDDFIITRVKSEVEKGLTNSEKKLEKLVIASVIDSLKEVRPLEITTLSGKKKILGKKILHEKTETILQYMASKMPILMVGPAGSGKTHIAVQCAEILDMEHHAISVNEQTSKTDFLGYKDATGQIVTTPFREVYEKGGVFIIDEIDAGNPNVLTVINSALSNDFCAFPDGMVKRHKDFICVCTANTFGQGESLQYIGRNILDAATKDRFVSVFINYSDVIETMLITTYLGLLKDLREYFDKNGLSFVVSTRGGIRLETLHSAKGSLNEGDIVDCLNLHMEVAKDIKIKRIIEKHASK